MTATDDRLTNGHTVNGHGTRWASFRPVTPTVVGPVEPLTQPLPAINDQPKPAAANTEQSELDPAKLAESGSTAVEAPALPPLPELPSQPTFDVDKEYWGHKALVAVYWIAILTGAVGQVVFFGDLFGLGQWGYAAAVIIATTAETVMVTSCDTALKHRVHGAYKRRWVPFLVVAFVAAFAASVMNLTHFWHISASLGLLFGGVSLLGFLLHVLDGFVKGSDHLDRKAEYDRAVAQRQAEQRERAEAAYERQLAEYETKRQAAERAIAQAEYPTAEPAPGKPAPGAAKSVKSTKSNTGRGKQQQGTTLDMAWQLIGEQLWTLGPAEVNRRLKEAGYAQVHPGTVRRWRKRQ